MSQLPPPIGSLWSNPATPLAEPRTPTTTYANDTATSQEAARSARDFAGTQAGTVLDALAAAGSRGLTMHEITDRTGIALQSVCARVAALRDANLITASDLTRQTPSGRKAVVWIAAGVTSRPASRPEHPAA